MNKRNSLVLVLFAVFVTFFSCTKNEPLQDISSLSNEEKIQLYDAKIKKDSKNAELYYERGKIFYEMGNTKEALFNSQKAIELNKKEVKYYIFEADVFFSRGETTLAFNALQEAVKVDSKSVEAYLKIAEISLDLQDYKRCLENIKRVLELDKVNAQAYFMRGWTMKETGDTNAAVRDYKKAIELKSDYEQPFEELGLLYAEKGDGLAVDYLKSTIKINPKNVHAMYALAMFYQEHEAIQQALDMYERILEIKPDYADAIHNVGWINYQYKKDYTTALDCFTKAIKADSTFYQAWYNRGMTYEKLGKAVEAESDFEKAAGLRIN
ncbi:MAG: tetratricopeptide repeat protein [Bacteroidales bacterium]|nr:tetratricopeptide repeat protein [Bacteroidales bacterium]